MSFGFQSYTVCLLIYPIFTWVDLDPYLEYGSTSTKFLTTDPIWIRICITDRMPSELFSVCRLCKERTRAGWLLIGAIMSLGGSVVKGLLPRSDPVAPLNQSVKRRPEPAHQII